MTNTKPGEKRNDTPPPTPPESPESLRRSRKVKIAIAAYLFVCFVLLIIIAAQIWPDHTLFSAPSAETTKTYFLFFEIQIPDEIRLILLVAIFGAMGSMVHALRSFNWHVVIKGPWTTSWLLRYILQPPTGAAIALVFYAIVRGGFYSPSGSSAAADQTQTGDPLPWVFAALAAIVGMFKEQAASKLKDIAEAVLKKPRPRDNKALLETAEAENKGE